MKAHIEQTGDGGLEVHAWVGKLTELTTDDMIDLIGDDPDGDGYTLAAEYVTEELIKRLRVGASAYPAMKKAVYQAIAPGPGYDEPFTFEV